MKKLILLSLLLAFVFSTGCSEGPKELFETARFEEKQNNPEHARQLYEEIIKKHPESEYSQKSKDRLSELNKNKK